MAEDKAWYESLLEADKVPDFLIRYGIRCQLAQKLRIESRAGVESQQSYLSDLLNRLKTGDIAINTCDANEQHYEVPTEFYQLVLGKRLKYSSGYWPAESTTFDESEEAMLRLYCERAGIEDGQSLMDLGCGWGSLSLYLAEKYPNSEILALSNSATQRAYIEQTAREKGFTRLRVETADINVFQTERRFDRILSVEMFEHMRNYEKLLSKVSDWLNPAGKLFVHIFTHQRFAYPFEADNKNNWMARYFFTGGMMPSQNLLLHFQNDLSLDQRWSVNGKHYQKTCEAWLARMDNHKTRIMQIFQETYGEKDSLKWWVYWRVFFMACAELFGYKGGSEWFVSHYLFSPHPQKVNQSPAFSAQANSN